MIKNKKEQENNNLVSYIRTILEAIKLFFGELLQIDNDNVKEVQASDIKDYYNKKFDKDDVYDIAIDTDKEDGLFDYADIDNYYSKDTLEL